MSEEQSSHGKEAWFTLSGDVNSDMVHRVFEAVSGMTEDGIETAHILVQSNGGYVSDGLCLYNFLSNAPVEFVMYNGGAVASIAVIVYLAGSERFASETARFMVHKSHATASNTRCTMSLLTSPDRVNQASLLDGEDGSLMVCLSLAKWMPHSNK